MDLVEKKVVSVTKRPNKTEEDGELSGTNQKKRGKSVKPLS